MIYKAGASQGTENNTEKPAPGTSRGDSSNTEKPEMAPDTSRGGSISTEKPEIAFDQNSASRGTQSSNGTDKKNSSPSGDTAA